MATFALQVAILLIVTANLGWSWQGAMSTRSTSASMRRARLRVSEGTIARDSTRSSTRLDVVQLAEVGDSLSNAFIGGTVGVMGAMVTLELKKGTTDLNLEQCPYCIGNGRLLCASCFGSCVNDNGEHCSSCGGMGLVECISCKGDGRNVPLMLVSKAQRNPEYAPDEISLDKP